LGTDKIIEINNAQLFSRSIGSCEWLTYRSFSPGNYAMDNGALYTVYSILNNMKPDNILEFGLGESSKLVHQFSRYYNTYAITIEHDKDWADFFIKGIPNDIKPNCSIHDLQFGKYNNLGSVLNKKYDFIIVDGPFGSKHHSRSQIIDVVVNGGLTKTFCILMHDTERIGEQETFIKVCDILEDHKITYHIAHYFAGIRQHSIICSENLKYLTTLNR
jgi:tRNA(Met) C34 N-acetyltransferase TmcA